MTRRETRRRPGWRGPLAVGGIILIGLSAALVAFAVYTCELDELQGTRDLSDGLRDLIRMERRRGPLPGLPAMQVQGSWAGMTLRSAAASTAAAPGGGATSAAAGNGVLVAWIDPDEGEPAQRAGIRPGDTIVGVDEQRIGGLADMRAASRKARSGQPLLIQILRQGQRLTMVMPFAVPPLQGFHDPGPQVIR